MSWSGDSNAGSRRSSWAPHAGQNRMIFDDILVSASRGLTDQEIQATAPGCDITRLRQCYVRESYDNMQTVDAFV